MDNKKKLLLKKYFLYLILFCCPFSIYGMQLTKAIPCNIIKNTNSGNIPNILKLSKCMVGSCCIIYEIISQKSQQPKHFLFNLEEMHQLIEQNNSNTIQCTIQNNDGKNYCVEFTFTDEDRGLIQATHTDQKSQHRRKNIKYEELDLVVTKKSNTVEYNLKNSEDNSSILLPNNSTNILQALISKLTWQDQNSTEKNLYFTIQKDSNSNIRTIVNLPVNTTTINKFPMQQKKAHFSPNTNKEVESPQQPKQEKNKSLEKITTLIDQLAQYDINSQQYYNQQKVLRNLLLQYIQTLDPYSISNLNFDTSKKTDNNDVALSENPSGHYTMEKQPDLVDQLEKNRHLSAFFKNIRTHVHPDKNNNNNIKQTTWSNMLLDLETHLHQEKKRSDENKEVIAACVFPYILEQTGSLCQALAFRLAGNKKANQYIDQLKLMTQQKTIETKITLLTTHNKINKSLKGATAKDFALFTKLCKGHL